MFYRHRLKNNLQLLTVPMPNTKAITVLALFPVGSRYEAKKQKGLSHFIEHMMFKGTTLRPTTLDLSRELDAVGAEYNAYTGRDHTGYYVKIDAAKAELALDLLSDMIFHSKFDGQEMEKEKGVIVEELNMYQDNPSLFIDQLFEETMYSGHPLGGNIGGEPATVKKMTRESLLDFYQRFYQPRNIVLILAGRINSQIKKLAKRYFEQKNAASKSLKFLPLKSEILKGTRSKIKFKETDQAHLALGFPAFSYDDKKTVPLALLNLILGGTMSSRLFIEVRERRGLAYVIHSGVNNYHETGNLMIEAGLDKKRLKEAISVILAEVEKMKKVGVTAEELRRAKDHFRGQLVLRCENSNFQAEWHGKQALLMKKIETPEQKLKRLEAAKVHDLQKIANQVFDRQKLKIAVIGPFKDEKFLRAF